MKLGTRLKVAASLAYAIDDRFQHGDLLAAECALQQLQQRLLQANDQVERIRERLTCKPSPPPDPRMTPEQIKAMARRRAR